MIYTFKQNLVLGFSICISCLLGYNKHVCVRSSLACFMWVAHLTCWGVYIIQLVPRGKMLCLNNVLGSSVHKCNYYSSSPTWIARIAILLSLYLINQCMTLLLFQEATELLEKLNSQYPAFFIQGKRGLWQYSIVHSIHISREREVCDNIRLCTVYTYPGKERFVTIFNCAQYTHT